MLCELEATAQRERRGGGARAHRSASAPVAPVAPRSDPVLHELLRLRHHMAHVVTNLQIYLQVRASSL